MPVLLLPPDLPEELVAAAQLFGNFAKLHLMHLMSEAGRPMSMAELARDLDTTKQTVRLYLRQLEAHGLVTADVPVTTDRQNPILWSINDDVVVRMGQQLISYARALDGPEAPK